MEDKIKCYTSSLKDAAPLKHINLNLSQPNNALIPIYCMLIAEATNANFTVFGLIGLGLKHKIYHIQCGMLTITPLMRFHFIRSLKVNIGSLIELDALK